MNLEKHLKQNTATIFDAHVVEVRTCIDIRKDSTIDDELSVVLDESSLTLLGVNQYSFFKAAILKTECGCTQALVFFDTDSILSLKPFMDKDDEFDPTCSFLFDNINVFVSDTEARVFIDEVEYAIPDEASKDFIDFFTALYSQETVKTGNAISELKKGLDKEIKSKIEESNVANFPQEIHEYMVKISYNKNISSLAISADGLHYLNMDTDNIYKLYVPVMDNDASVSQLYSDAHSLSVEEQEELFPSTMSKKYTRFSHKELDYKLIEDTYDGFTVYCIAASPEFINDNFDPDKNPLDNIVNLLK